MLSVVFGAGKACQKSEDVNGQAAIHIAASLGMENSTSPRTIDVSNTGALIITYTILGAPFSNCGIMGPPNPLLIIMAPTYSLHCSSFFWLTKISIIGS